VDSSQGHPAIQKLQDWDRDAVSEVLEFRGETTIVVPAGKLLPVAQFLVAEPSLAFTYLSDIAAVDRFPLQPRFEVNYHLLSIERKDRIRMKVRIAGNDPEIPSVVSVWPTANWHERENFDLMGIKFYGHPDLTRILMPDEWQGHPLRKDYPVEGYR
jgi:NADH-quinone oxidoreductase subunit C